MANVCLSGTFIVQKNKRNAKFKLQQLQQYQAVLFGCHAFLLSKNHHKTTDHTKRLALNILTQLESKRLKTLYHFWPDNNLPFNIPFLRFLFCTPGIFILGKFIRAQIIKKSLETNQNKIAKVNLK